LHADCTPHQRYLGKLGMPRSRARLVGDIDQLIGERIRTRRMILKMSQGELASTLGVTFQQIQKYEKGVNRISVGRILQIADVLKVSPMAILSGDARATEETSTPFSKFLATRTGIDLIEAMVEIKSPEVRRAIADLAMTLRGR
jgi:transcriptional regulator with XRE-family HTH domain